MAVAVSWNRQQVTIGNGTSLSPAVPLGDWTLCGIAMPAGWDAASLTFQVSVDGGTTWLEMIDGASALSLTAAAGQYLAFEPFKWLGANMLRVRSGTSGSAVNQTADRVLTLITRAMAN
jgi:hypothetical protein